MNEERCKWMEEASYKLKLLLKFEGDFIIPDKKTLRAFLNRPTLIFKMMYKDSPDILKEELDKLRIFEEENRKSVEITEDNLRKLEEFYEKGFTSDYAALEIVKWCDTPEESGKYIVSPEIYTFQMMIAFLVLAVIVGIAVILMGTLKDKENVKIESSKISNAYSKSNDFTGYVENNLNAWDGNIEMKSSKNLFELQYNNVPSFNTCIMLIEKQKETGWSSIIIDGKELKELYKIKDSDIALACRSKKESVNIVFQKYK